MTFLLAVLIAAQAVEAPERSARDAVQKIIARMAESDLAAVWDQSAELEALGDEAVPSVEDGLSSTSVRVRLGCAKALVAFGQSARAEQVLREIADGKAPIPERMAALVLLRSSFDESLPPILKRIAENDPEPLVRIEAARTLWEVSEDARARRIIEGFLESSDRQIKVRAALALGEIGYVEGLTKKILGRVSSEPTPEGMQAGLILQIEKIAREGEASANPFNLDAESLVKVKQARIDDLERELKALREGKGGDPREGDPLIAWIRTTIQSFYVDLVGVSDEKLRVGAARGMTQVLDRFSAFMDSKETQEFTESITGSYSGIGAQISQDRDTNQLTIVRPLAGGPAKRADLKAGDRILEIDGVPTRGKTMADIVRLLKGENGTTVKLKVQRWGWKEPREFPVVRGEIKVEALHAEMLPGGIAYVRPDHFGETTYADLRKALEELRGQGMQSIILDLRGNPGGLLSAAVQIVDMFIADDPRPIVTQKGRVGVKEEMSFDKPPQYLNEPLAILVDRTSASASEIVAGALQDFDQRAVLVGERTFGKGSVQRVFPVPDAVAALAGGRASLRLTVQYYYLPSGTCIHTQRDAEGKVIEEGGVLPKIVVRQRTFPLWKAHELEKLAESKELRNRVRTLMEESPTNKDRETCVRLLREGDGGDPGRYPGFDGFYASIKDTFKAEPEEVRLVLRSELRRMWEDMQGREMPCDFQDDRQLQRAILEVLKRQSVDPAGIASFAGFAAANAKEAEEAEEAKAVSGQDAEGGEGEGGEEP